MVETRDQNQAIPAVSPTEAVSLSENSDADSVAPKPKEVNIFQRLFQPEKKVQSEEPPAAPEVPLDQELVITVNHNGTLKSGPDTNILQPESQEPAAANRPPSQIAAAQDDHTDTDIHPVMSFFKTLVNKPAPKSEEEVRSGAEDQKENGGLRKSSSKKEKGKSPAQQAEDAEVKKKKTEGPKSGTLGRLFRSKSKKEEQTSGDKVEEEQPLVVAVSLNAEQSAPELVVEPEQKATEVDTPPAGTPVVVEPPAVSVSVNPEKSEPEPLAAPDSQETNAIVAPPESEKPVKETPLRPISFWRKSFKADPPPPPIQENVAIEQPAVSVSVKSEKSEPEPIVAPDLQQADAVVASPKTEKPPKETSSRPIPFWRKSFKADPPPPPIQENVAAEQPALSVSVNFEKSSPELVAAPDSQQADAIVTPPETPSRPVPFWRKSFKAEPPPPPIQENEEAATGPLTDTASAEPNPPSSKPDSSAKPGTSGDSKSQEGKKADEGKNAKPKLMMFFKQLSIIGDPSAAASEEVTEKYSPTLDFTDGVELGKSEKTTVTAVVEPPPPPPPPQKSKDNPKDKKGSSEKLSKQESRESPEAAATLQIQAPEPGPAQNGAEPSRESQLKKTEKRQSLGSFFKGIGPKRLCDAEVQTDPVSILPVEKAK
ncbi:breast carcinoma-amplified sequence 1 [Gastrophryne carolinensis]